MKTREELNKKFNELLRDAAREFNLRDAGVKIAELQQFIKAHVVFVDNRSEEKEEMQATVLKRLKQKLAHPDLSSDSLVQIARYLREDMESK